MGGAVVAGGGGVVAAGGGVVAAGGAVVPAGGGVVDAGGAVVAAGGAVVDVGCVVVGGFVAGAVVGVVVGPALVVADAEAAGAATEVGTDVAVVVGAMDLAVFGLGSAARAAGAARSSLVTDATSAEAPTVGAAARPGASIASATRRMPRAIPKTGTTANQIRRTVLPQRLGLGPGWVGQAAAQAERLGKRASDG